MNLFKIDINQAKQLGQIISDMKYSPISFDDSNLVPVHEDPYITENFFFFMTAIDHKTHGLSEKKFKAKIEGKLYYGSDLLYFLSRKTQAKTRDFFTAENLKDITGEEISSIFSVNSDIRIKNPELRAMLLRDASLKLLLYYNGDIRTLLRKAEGYLRREDNLGILQQLKIFRAYEDPIEKKSLLLVKILRRQGYLEIRDKENLSVPVDNVLMTIALRSGLVKVIDDSIRKKLLNGRILDDTTVLLLREATRNAFNIVSNVSSLDADILDDILWTYGREFINRRPSKDRIESNKVLLGDNVNNKNALRQFLLLSNGLSERASSESRLYKEPNCPDTWYF